MSWRTAVFVTLAWASSAASAGAQEPPPPAPPQPCDTDPGSTWPCDTAQCHLLPRDPVLLCGPKRSCGDSYMGLGGSMLPGVGAWAQVGRVFRADARATWALELEAGWQPLDDKAFIANGDPANDGWWQLQVGFKRRSDPAARRHWVWRGGAFLFEAGSVPNWVNTEGLWAGAYVGFGFETDLSPSLSFGPTFTVMAGGPLENDGNFNATPQLTWGFTWWPGAGSGCAPRCPCLEKGEVYLDAGVSFLPGIGRGSVGLGQVFARSRAAVWSFEIAAAFQSIEAGTLMGESDGEFAQLQGGIKVLLSPRCRAHPVLRAGATWLRTTGEVSALEQAADHVGLYASVGYEWDLAPSWSTGPELLLAAVARESNGASFEFLPRAAWHVIHKF